MIKVLGLGDNVVDKYMHIKTMYPGGNALNIAVLARLSGGTSCTGFAARSSFAANGLLR